MSQNPKVKIYAPNDFFALGAPTKFPFRETGPGAAKKLPKVEQYLRGKKAVEAVAPAHCTGHHGFSVFKEFGANYRFFGPGETLNF